MQTLLDQPNLPREAYLGVGALAGRYCKAHKCGTDETYKTLARKLIAKLNQENRNEFVLILRTLGKLNYLDSASIKKILGVAQNKATPSKLRAAALDVLLTDACDDETQEGAMKILRDVRDNSEIRIKAYLAVAKCPKSVAAYDIKSLLEEESSDQGI